MLDVCVPEPVICPCPVSEEDKEDWTEDCSELFEWTGMACLGSQRYGLGVDCVSYLDRRPFEIDYLRMIDATRTSLRTHHQATLVYPR